MDNEEGQSLASQLSDILNAGANVVGAVKGNKKTTTAAAASPAWLKPVLIGAGVLAAILALGLVFGGRK